MPSRQPETPDRTVREAMVEGWQQARQSLQLQIKLIQQRLRDVVLARQQWNVRFEVFNHQGTPEQLAEWATHANSSYAADSGHAPIARGRVQGVDGRDRAARETTPRAAAHGTLDAAKWVEYQMANMHALSQAYATHLIQVETFERMLAKLTAALDRRPGSGPDGALAQHRRGRRGGRLELRNHRRWTTAPSRSAKSWPDCCCS